MKKAREPTLTFPFAMHFSRHYIFIANVFLRIREVIWSSLSDMLIVTRSPPGVTLA